MTLEALFTEMILSIIAITSLPELTVFFGLS